MYSISIFYFTFYLFGGCVRTPLPTGLLPVMLLVGADIFIFFSRNYRVMHIFRRGTLSRFRTHVTSVEVLLAGDDFCRQNLNVYVSLRTTHVCCVGLHV